MLMPPLRNMHTRAHKFNHCQSCKNRRNIPEILVKCVSSITTVFRYLMSKLAKFSSKFYIHENKLSDVYDVQL